MAPPRAQTHRRSTRRPTQPSPSRYGGSLPATTGEPLLADMEWEPDTAPDSAAVEARLKGIARFMPFATALLGRSGAGSSPLPFDA
jgi:hypothetical protein